MTDLASPLELSPYVPPRIENANDKNTIVQRAVHDDGLGYGLGSLASSEVISLSTEMGEFRDPG